MNFVQESLILNLVTVSQKLDLPFANQTRKLKMSTKWEWARSLIRG